MSVKKLVVSIRDLGSEYCKQNCVLNDDVSKTEKRLSVSICDISSEYCQENCFLNDKSLIPSKLTQDIPIDDLCVTRNQKSRKETKTGLSEAIGDEIQPVTRISKRKEISGTIKNSKRLKNVKIGLSEDRLDRKPCKDAEEQDKNDDSESNYTDENDDSDYSCTDEDASGSKHTDEEESNSSYKDGEDSNSSYKENSYKKKKSKSSKKENSYKMKKSKSSKSKVTLSSYEKMLEDKRSEKMMFLQSLNIDEAKAGFSEILSNIKRKTQQAKKNKKKEIPEAIELRKSTRLKNVKINLSEDVLAKKTWGDTELFEKRAEKKPIKEPVKGIRNSTRLEKIKIDLSESGLAKKYWLDDEETDPPVPFELSFEEALESKNLYEDYMKDIDVEKLKSEKKFHPYDISALSEMYNCQYVETASSILSHQPSVLSWYPSAESLIVASGHAQGRLNILNMDSEHNSYTFKIHDENITNVQFNPVNPIQLISSSTDGKLCCGDMEKEIFYEVYDISAEAGCTYFDFLSSTTYLVSQTNGRVALIDARTKRSHIKNVYTCHDVSINSVNMHPVNNNFFVTGDKNGSVHLWDLRNMYDPLLKINIHTKSVNSAFFSPVTGNSILTTSCDNSVCIINSMNMKHVELEKSMDILRSGNVSKKFQEKVRNKEFRMNLLGQLKATWLPNCDDAFIIGSLCLHPNKINIFDTDMNAYSTVTHDSLPLHLPVCIVHPCRPALAAMNTRGKLYVFT